LTAECHLLLGNNERARLRAAKGVSVAEREYLLEAKAYLLVLEARAYERLACPEVALELLERALDAFTASSYRYPVAELDATLLAYALAHRLGQFQRAGDLLERAQRHATALGTQPQLAALDLAQAHEALVTGDWTAARRFLSGAEATLAHEQACAQWERVAEMLADLRSSEIPATGSGMADTAVNLANVE
jgi:tetratricopeptide (TPR) repeat protein